MLYALLVSLIHKMVMQQKIKKNIYIMLKTVIHSILCLTKIIMICYNNNSSIACIHVKELKKWVPNRFWSRDYNKALIIYILQCKKWYSYILSPTYVSISSLFKFLQNRLIFIGLSKDMKIYFLKIIKM